MNNKESRDSSALGLKHPEGHIPHLLKFSDNDSELMLTEEFPQSQSLVGFSDQLLDRLKWNLLTQLSL